MILITLQAAKPSLLKKHLKRSTNRSRAAEKDEYTQYCSTEVVNENKCGFSSHLEWWKAHESQYSQLSQMVKNIFSISSMSAEVECLFSSSKLMISDHRNKIKLNLVEADECIRSWALSELVLDTYFKYLTATQKTRKKFKDQKSWVNID